MAKPLSKQSRNVAPSALARAMRTLVLLLPATLLSIAALRVDAGGNLMLWLGCCFQLLVCLLDACSRQGVRQPMGPSVVTMYVIGLGWLWLGVPNASDWYLHLAKAILLVIPLICFSLQILQDSGAPALRRAHILADRLATRREWPIDLASCRTLPEVKALREAIQRDAAPALALLTNPQPEVQVSALAALEFRKDWRPGQAEVVLMTAQRAREPIIRACAVAALGNLDDRSMMEALGEFLRDPAREVRRAAKEALLWDSEHRWPWIRHALHRSLADPSCADDGPLCPHGQVLPTEAVADLTAWAAQKGLVSQRAATTLGAHYTTALTQCPSEELLQDLRRQIADPHTPAVLRIELSRLLQNGRSWLDRPLLEQLLAAANPAPLRLQAVESLLNIEPGHSEAMSVLKSLARLPNRELALATADIVQRRLGVDLGLALGEPLPPTYSRQAAEVTRRIMSWASRPERSSRESGVHKRPAVN